MLGKFMQQIDGESCRNLCYTRASGSIVNGGTFPSWAAADMLFKLRRINNGMNLIASKIDENTYKNVFNLQGEETEGSFIVTSDVLDFVNYSKFFRLEDNP